MQKVWRQIGLTMPELTFLHNYMVENSCKNETQAISCMFKHIQRLETIINQLEKQAHKAEMWRQRANSNVKERQEGKKDGN